jgi:2-oxo-4-hydroxy-4-carboxy-5-ureidoimidazoline decarboxylase
MSEMIPLSRVNAMTTPAFVECFGSIAEHSPWVAEAALADRPFADLNAMIRSFDNAVRSASRELQLDLLRAHPDLAGRTRKIAVDSKREQKDAGLGALSPEEYARFQMLNETYRDRFGFPFIFAVRGATKHEILEAFQRRIANSAETEFDAALRQVCTILRFRLEDKVAP